MNITLTPSEEQEVRKHNIGIIILLVGICCLLMGAAVPTFGAIGALILIVGIVMSLMFRSKATIIQKKEQNQALANLMVQQAKAGVKIDVDKYTSKPNESSGAKEIIKGAVVGGIIGGDAGAVVGAVAAKNKIDNKKK